MSLVEKRQEADFTKEVDELESQLDSLTKAGKTQDALEQILALEKKTRNAADLVSTMRLLLFAILVLRTTPNIENPQWDQLNDTIVSLSKRHGQLKQAITKMIGAAMCFLYAPGIGESGKHVEEKKETENEVEMDNEEKKVADPSKESGKQEDKDKSGEESAQAKDEKRQKMKEAIDVDEDRGEGQENEKVSKLMEQAKSIGDQGVTDVMKLKLVETIRQVTEGKVRFKI